MILRPLISLFTFLWLVVGVSMAAAYDYFDKVDNGKRIALAVLSQCPSGRSCSLA